MVLLDCAEKALLGDLYLLGLAQGLEEALVESGYGPVVNATRDSLRKVVAAQAPDGVVLAIGKERQLLARELAAQGAACVVINERYLEDIPGVGWVTLDLDSGAREAARMLFNLGHRRIAFLGNYEDDLVRDGFTSELRHLGVPIQPGLEVIAGKGREAGRSAMSRLLSLSESPTAVFARTDLLASGALLAAEDLGIRIPEDLSIVGHDDIHLASTLGLTTVRIDCKEMGRAAAEVLTNLRHQKSAPATVPVIRTKVIVRNTAGPSPSLPLRGGTV